MPMFVNLEELNPYLRFMHPIVTSKTFSTVMDAVVWLNVCVLMLEHKGMSPFLRVCMCVHVVCGCSDQPTMDHPRTFTLALLCASP